MVTNLEARRLINRDLIVALLGSILLPMIIAILILTVVSFLSILQLTISEIITLVGFFGGIGLLGFILLVVAD